MVRGRELAEVTKAVHWATLRQPAPVLTTAFAQFRALVRPPMRRPTWPATAGRYLHKSAILRVASRALLTATTELRIPGGRLRAPVLARLGNRSCFPRWPSRKAAGIGAGARGCPGVGAGWRGLGVVTFAGAFSGPHGGCLVAVELGEVVTHHD
jgi:hypothetical protein